MTTDDISSSQPFSVNGKTAIVTGAGSGINLEFAKLLVSLNCNVVLADLALRPEAAEFVSKYEANKEGPRAVFVETNVTKWADITRMFEFTLAQFGDFDILCPGAGVYEPHWSSFWHPPGSSESRDSPDGDRYALLDINLTHPIRATQLAMSHWLHPRPSANSKFPTPKPVSLQNPKRVIHISSVAGQLPVFRAPIYGATKHAISGFVRCLAPVADVGISVTAVAPGVVKTPLWTDHPEKLVNVNEGQDAWVTPQEVAEAMLQCVQQEPGGTILEVGSKFVRPVKAVNDPGPDLDPKRGLATSNTDKGNSMVWEWLQDPKFWG
ncbi:hypothetical protein PFICI_03602 [Pestalotiopsis fici W106-1]|uniref:Uncharacterized protein n=1 Tax=Pestalotiopsis fici (strain W106-1 / CGMCC3.15140) TaxID=1229662 RepID=W3XJE3_PESFW|nr:uncharacterized protein PFICI_03602 [Pestalotiopsis fici W106-1]ETS85577.1 hypothetical protein PFICI_03602 [Pestalotiopsis fici W106-1]